MENEKYKEEVTKFNHDIQKINDAFNQKLQITENKINEYKSKIKEYKNKIISLKTKINELHNEIAQLKQNDKLMFDALDSFANKSLLNPSNTFIKNKLNSTNENQFNTLQNQNYIYNDYQDSNDKH
jgi:predicted RNase H-like nuclease (RuvC/YqgF family)